MIEFVKNHKKLSGFVAFISLVLGLVGWEASSGLRGYLAARVDVARGHYRLLEVGLPVSYRLEFDRMLRERYGVETSVVAGCVVTEELLAYVARYNAVSMNAANRKFGHNIFKECLDDAGRIWESRKPARGSTGDRTPAGSSSRERL